LGWARDISTVVRRSLHDPIAHIFHPSPLGREEFCYKVELENQLLVRNNMMKSPYRRKVRIPQPYVNLCCKHVLVMEMLDGIKFKDSIQLKLARLAGGHEKEVEKFMVQRQKGKFVGSHRLACPSLGSII
jgi:hypothetical protein